MKRYLIRINRPSIKTIRDNLWKWTLGLVVIVGVVLAFSSCSEQLTDLKGIEIQDPDTVSVYRNVDNFPNIAIMCIDGDALIMRSSNYDDMMILHIPDNDNNLCE